VDQRLFQQRLHFCIIHWKNSQAVAFGPAFVDDITKSWTAAYLGNFRIDRRTLARSLARFWTGLQHDDTRSPSSSRRRCLNFNDGGFFYIDKYILPTYQRKYVI
jgi:hypothetical protein